MPTIPYIETINTINNGLAELARPYELVLRPLPAHTATTKHLWREDAADLGSRVYDYVRRCGVAGATDEQIADDFGMSRDATRRARLRLVDDGMLWNSESRTRRQTASGRPATIWLACEE